MKRILWYVIPVLLCLTLSWPGGRLHEAAAELQDQPIVGIVVSAFSVASQTVEPQGIEFLNNYLYVSRGEHPYAKVYQYDTEGNFVQEISTANGCPRELVWDGAYFWHPDTCFHKILKMDAFGNPIQSFASPHSSPCAIAWDGTDLWLSFAGQGNKIFRMDASGNLTGDSVTMPTAGYPSGLVFVDGYFWVSSYMDEKIYQVDMAGNVVSSFDAPGTQPAGLAYDGNDLWHTDIGTAQVYQIEIYKGSTGSVQATISPQGAIDAGAQWRIDGGIWRASGHTQILPTGEHTLEFSDISGWEKPDNQRVEVSDSSTTMLSGVYVPRTGSLVVTIAPQGAIDAGAKWRRVGTRTWLNSGIIEAFIPGGQHTVEFSPVPAWTKPANQTVTISNGEATTISGEYTPPVGSLRVSISPHAAVDAGAKWRRFGTMAWLNSGAIETGVPAGPWIVEFSDVSGWTKPVNENLKVINGRITTLTRTYLLRPGSLLVTIIPQAAINGGAKWRRVGMSTWRSSGNSETGIPVGQHRVEFSEVSGWAKPGDQTVTISHGVRTSATGTYGPITGSLQVRIGPQTAIDAGAKWRRLRTSTWLSSGATETGIGGGSLVC